jgi:hypothetical protein
MPDAIPPPDLAVATTAMGSPIYRGWRGDRRFAAGGDHQRCARVDHREATGAECSAGLVVGRAGSCDGDAGMERQLAGPACLTLSELRVDLDKRPMRRKQRHKALERAWALDPYEVTERLQDRVGSVG